MLNASSRLSGAIAIAAASFVTNELATTDGSSSNASKFFSSLDLKAEDHHLKPSSYVPPPVGLTVKMAQVMFRHGERSPVVNVFKGADGHSGVELETRERELWASRMAPAAVIDELVSQVSVVSNNPTTPIGDTSYPFGCLTSYGVFQAYCLGKYLREIYIKNAKLSLSLSSGLEARSGLYIRSTNYRRTIGTASAVLAGLIPRLSLEQQRPEIFVLPYDAETLGQFMSYTTCERLLGAMRHSCADAEVSSREAELEEAGVRSALHRIFPIYRSTRFTWSYAADFLACHFGGRRLLDDSSALCGSERDGGASLDRVLMLHGHSLALAPTHVRLIMQHFVWRYQHRLSVSDVSFLTGGRTLRELATRARDFATGSCAPPSVAGDASSASLCSDLIDGSSTGSSSVRDSQPLAALSLLSCHDISILAVVCALRGGMSGGGGVDRTTSDPEELWPPYASHLTVELLYGSVGINAESINTNHLSVAQPLTAQGTCTRTTSACVQPPAPVSSSTSSCTTLATPRLARWYIRVLLNGRPLSLRYFSNHGDPESETSAPTAGPTNSYGALARASKSTREIHAEDFVDANATLCPLNDFVEFCFKLSPSPEKYGPFCRESVYPAFVAPEGGSLYDVLYI